MLSQCPSSVLEKSDQLAIKTSRPIHSGKVRSVYWLDQQDSDRLIATQNYDVAPGTDLAVMVISDRISAFECIWHAEDGLRGVPGKGAALNTISSHWFKLFNQQGLANNHILAVPHPLVWIVQKAQPVMIEAIARQYITGSMWRAYDKGERNFCGIVLPDDLQRDQRLPELLITPSTKGILKGIPGVPESDDVNVTRSDIERNYSAFKFRNVKDITTYEKLLTEGFALIGDALEQAGQIFVDTKFEFGYVSNAAGEQQLIYMDEVGTPDSSRIWDAKQYAKGKVVENSKEGFRQFLLSHFDDPDILTNKSRMEERYVLARDNLLPAQAMMDVSDTYVGMAEKITGQALSLSDDPQAEILDILSDRYQLIA